MAFLSQAHWGYIRSPLKLDPLLNPLRFAARRGFSNLGTLRDLEQTLARGSAAVRGQSGLTKADVTVLDAVEPLIAGLDRADDVERRRRIAAMLEALGHPVEEEQAPAPAKKERASARASASSPRRAATTELPSSSAPPKVSSTGLFAAAPKVVAQRRGRRIPMAAAEPSSVLAEVTGVGPKTAERLAAKGFEAVQDLMFFVPRQYDDRSHFTEVAALAPGLSATVRGEVLTARVRPTGRGKRVFELAVSDGTGVIECRFFRFPARIETKYPRGTQVVVSGPVTAWGARRQMIHPDLESVDSVSVQPQGILPVYGEVEGVPPKTLRKIIMGLAQACGDRVPDILPDWLRESYGLPSLGAAVRAVHLPERANGLDAVEAMRQRLVFDELLLLQLALQRTRRQREAEPGLVHRPQVPVDQLAADLLPFALTKAQARVLEEVVDDLGADRPMNRLVQGDVGSGKTAVALVAAAAVCSAGRQAALLAPTEILADQHFSNALKTLSPSGLTVARLTGSAKAKERRQLLRALAAQQVDVLVGTHALLEPDVAFADLGLAIVDEQHRFGVQQRASLRDKRTDVMPDLLLMTATPIPRTLALTAYGDLRVSVIDELPPGRQPSETLVFRQAQVDAALDRVATALTEGRQAYVVYPLVEASEKLDLKAATEAADELRARFAPHEVGLLHGRMRPDDKAAIMRRFKDAEVAVLVSTTVIEVGVDVPNATVMLIQHADRFGLSQLHQLRGRVGRGGHGGTCLLVAGDASEDGWARLGVLAETSDGFVVAERDLALRGPGEILGTRQSGLPDLVVTNLARDGRVLESAKAACERLNERDPELASEEHARLRSELERRFGARLKLTQAG